MCVYSNTCEEIRAQSGNEYHYNQYPLAVNSEEAKHLRGDIKETFPL